MDIIYAVLMISCLFVSGLNQHNDLILGIMLIVMGIITIPVALFYIHMKNKNWQPLFWYDYLDNSYFISKKEREEDISTHRFIRTFMTFFLVLLAIGLPILGIIRLP